MAWKPEVFINGKWCRNSLVFASEQEAKDNALDLMTRWFLADDSRATEVNEAVNYSYINRKLIAV